MEDKDKSEHITRKLPNKMRSFYETKRTTTTEEIVTTEPLKQKLNVITKEESLPAKRKKKFVPKNRW